MSDEDPIHLITVTNIDGEKTYILTDRPREAAVCWEGNQSYFEFTNSDGDSIRFNPRRVESVHIERDVDPYEVVERHKKEGSGSSEPFVLTPSDRSES